MFGPLLQSEPLTVWRIIGAFFDNDIETLTEAFTSPDRFAFAIWIVVLAALSETIAQSIILFANRVRPARFLLSVVVSIGIFVFGFAVWVITVKLVAQFLFGTQAAWDTLTLAVAISYVPLILSFLALMPYLGSPIVIALYIWSFVVLVPLLAATLQLSQFDAFVCSILGLIIIVLLRTTIGRPIMWLGEHLLQWAAGTRLQFDVETALGADDPLGSSGGEAGQ